MYIPPQVLEGLLVATGFTGALTFVWLFRLLARLLWRPLAVVAHSSSAASEALLREISGARREVLILARRFSGRSLAQSLLDARKRGARVELVVAPSGRTPGDDVEWLGEQGLKATISKRLLDSHFILIDEKTLLTASSAFPEGETEVIGQVLVIKGHPELFKECRRLIESAKVVPEKAPSAPVIPEPAKAPAPVNRVAVPEPAKTPTPVNRATVPEPAKAPTPANRVAEPVVVASAPAVPSVVEPVAPPGSVVFSRPALLPQRPTWEAADEEVGNLFLPPPNKSLDSFLPPAEVEETASEEAEDEEPMVPLGSAALLARLRQTTPSEQEEAA